MNKKIFCKVATLIFALTIFLTAKVSAEGIWRLDGEFTSDMPRNFRIMEDLKISASGQPSMQSLMVLFNELKHHSDGDIYIVDLREESHGFLNGYPVSYYTEKNLANFFKPRNQIENIEYELITDMRGQKVDLLPLGNEDKKLFKPKNILVDLATVESEAAEALGFVYQRFPVTDMFFPTPDIVEKFIIFALNVQEKDWVHFHCQAGHGRTTTFTVMYEILKHPEKSLEEISAGQIALGGSDLLTHNDGDPKNYYVQAHNSRAAELRKFYDYAYKFNHGGIDISWSEYAKQNR